MKFWKCSLSLAAVYGSACVGLAAAVMHLWQGSLGTTALGSLLSAVAILAFHTLALCILSLYAPQGRLFKLIAVLWHTGVFFFVWTVFAGIFKLPLHYSMLAPLGGQTLMVAWLLLAVASWSRK